MGFNRFQFRRSSTYILFNFTKKKKIVHIFGSFFHQKIQKSLPVPCINALIYMLKNLYGILHVVHLLYFVCCVSNCNWFSVLARGWWPHVIFSTWATTTCTWRLYSCSTRRVHTSNNLSGTFSKIASASWTLLKGQCRDIFTT